MYKAIGMKYKLFYIFYGFKFDWHLAKERIYFSN